MKNLYKLLGIAALALAIVFSFAACEQPTNNNKSSSTSYSTTGQLKITGLSSYNGKYVYAQGADSAATYMLQGLAGLSSSEWTFGKIANGEVTLKVFKITPGESAPGNYDATETVSMILMITTKDKIGANSSLAPADIVARGVGPVPFTSGKTPTAVDTTTTSWAWY
jgi:hypothetical protein